MDQVEPRPREGGFTLVEMLVVISITAFVFLALAALLAGAARSLAVAKTRTQANEIATQGIEDLQRYDFNDLGVCSGAADPTPATIPASLTGLTSVQLANCGFGIARVRAALLAAERNAHELRRAPPDLYVRPELDHATT